MKTNKQSDNQTNKQHDDKCNWSYETRDGVHGKSTIYTIAGCDKGIAALKENETAYKADQNCVLPNPHTVPIAYDAVCEFCGKPVNWIKSLEDYCEGLADGQPETQTRPSKCIDFDVVVNMPYGEGDVHYFKYSYERIFNEIHNIIHESGIEDVGAISVKVKKKTI